MTSPEELLEKCPDLSTLPSVYHKLNEAINSPSCTTGIISRIISHDPILTIKVLKMVNSAFYGFPHEIEDIPQAIVIIGMQQLNDLVLAHSIINLFNNQSTAPFKLEDFWKFSLACGLESKILASYSSKKFSERIFVGGLLHNIGKLLMAAAEPEKYTRCCELSQEKSLPILEAEKNIFGYDHTNTNRVIMSSWNIPHSISDITSNYITPAKSDFSTESSLVLLSHAVVQSISLGCSGEFYISPVSDNVLEVTGLSTAKVEESLIPLKEQFTDISNTFLG